MNIKRKNLRILLWAWILWGVAAPLAAQDPLNVGARPAAPAAGAGEAGTTTQEGPVVDLATLAKEDPVLMAIQESNPTTPPELTRAAQTLLDLGHPELSKQFLQRLLAAQLSPADLAQLQQKFGSALFMRLSRDKRIAPEGGQLSDAVLEAAAKAARDPNRIDRLIAQLDDADPALRYAAQVDLRSAGRAAVIKLIPFLGDPGKEAAVRSTLIDLNDEALDPLIGVLVGADDARRIQAMLILGRLRAKRAVLFLVGSYADPESAANIKQAAGLALEKILGARPTSDDARRFLFRRVQALMNGQLPRRADLEGTVETWIWNPKLHTVAAIRSLAEDASVIMAARAANDLLRLDPDNPEVRRLYLAANLAAAKIVYGRRRHLPWGAPADPFLEQVLREKSETLDGVLKWALDQGHGEAAIGAAEALGQVASVQALRSANGGPSTLARALENKDPLVRFAALEAILTIDPQRSFAGSSRVPEALAFFISATAQRKALIASPRLEYAGTLAGILTQLGFETELASTGKDLLRRAARSPDYEFILISEYLTRPPAGETLQTLRLDYRLARIPVAVLSNAEDLKLTPFTVDDDPRTMVSPPPRTLNSTTNLVQRLLELERQGSDADQRIVQAEVALYWLARLSQQPSRYRFYDLLRTQRAVEQALTTPALTTRAAEVLGLLATPSAQRALVDIASQSARPAAHRQAAAAAFETAVKRRGILLTTDQILQQYDRYNHSDKLGEETQQILGSILNTLESRGKSQVKGKRPNEAENGVPTG